MSSLETLPTRLMPDLLDRKAGASPLMVFDMGFGVHETVNYFGDRRCRLHFAGVPDALNVPPSVRSKTPFGQLVDKAEQDEAIQRAWLERFQNILNFEPGTQFDLCLFWDYFNYLDDLALKAFADALAPYVGPQTLGHAYVLLKPEVNVLNREYGILARDQISVRPGRHGNLPSFPRPQARMTSMMKGFAVNHSVLRRDGLLEVALKSA
ncbi:MAG: hypothetical protein KKD00_04020 [Gammaproteobacteria bacterium]|nr:hypothetical protein [Gammaproteobacteria bacterium]